MSYIGSTFSQQLTTPAVDYFNGNGVTTTFQLTRAVTSIFAIQVVVNNVPQNAREAYGITASNQIVFTSAPSAGTNNIYVIYDSQVGQTVTPSPGTVQSSSISSGGPSWDVNGNLTVSGNISSLRTENLRTSSYTLALTDNGRVVAMNTPGSASITVPPNSAVPFPVGSVVWLAKVIGAGTVSLVAGSGVTLSRTGNFGANEEIYIRKRDTDSWIVIDAPKNPVGTGGTISAGAGFNLHTFSSVGAGTFSAN
jgi:hypothetical protein